MSSGKSFAHVESYFSQDFNVYAPDLKGFGDNSAMEYPYSLDDYVNDVKRYIKEKGLVKPNIIAHSFGARIAIKLAAQNPNVFDKIVLTGAAGLKPKRSAKYYVKTCVFKILKLIAPKEKLSFFYSKDYNSLSPVMKRSFCMIVKEHLNGYLARIENPTLLVFGSCDKETPLYMAEKLQKGIKGSTLKVINGAGHFAFVDKPIRFSMEVRDFLLSR